MRLLLDQGLPRSLATLLQASGVEADHVGLLGMAHASDEDILARAVSEEAVVVTRDSDYHMLLVLSQADRPSVIWLRRTEGMKADALLPLLLRVLEQTTDTLNQGAVVTADEKSIRGRLLPIGKSLD